MGRAVSSEDIKKILAQAEKLALRNRAPSDKPLGVEGEVAEFEAAQQPILALVSARQAGYDAIRQIGSKSHRLSIKGLRILPGSSKSHRVGRIDIAKPFDTVLLVLMDEKLDATAIFEAWRNKVIAAPGLKVRNERGAPAVSKFKAISKYMWSRDEAQTTERPRSRR